MSSECSEKARTSIFNKRKRTKRGLTLKQRQNHSEKSIHTRVELVSEIDVELNR